MSRLVLIFLFIVTCSPSYSLDLYVEGGISNLRTSVQSTTFNLPSLEARVGGYVYRGIALEIQAGTGLSDATKDDIELSLDYLASAQVRFETPESKGSKLFLGAGYGISALDMNRSATGLPGSEDFKSGNFSLGYEYRPVKSKDLFLNLKWQRLYAEGSIKIDSLGLSLRHAF